jgi:hypothetical protein
MLLLVEILDIVQPYAPFFAPVFAPKARRQFQGYISGLMVSDNQTVGGINRLCVLDLCHQSSLNDSQLRVFFRKCRDGYG